jgi:hypothetical protein
MATTKFNLPFSSEEVMSTSVYKSKSGYNYASLNIAKGEDQYINISYEWKGNDIPDLAMDILSYMQVDNKTNKTVATVEAEEKLIKESAAFTARLKECL